MRKSWLADGAQFAKFVLRQTLVFRAGVERFGLPLANVLEVCEQSAAPVGMPGAPDWLAGMINHHGRVIPVVHLDQLLEVERKPDTEADHQLMLVELADDTVALLVDQIESIEDVRSEGPSIRGRRRAWLRGRLLTLLEPEMLFETMRRRAVHEQPEQPAP